MSSHRFEVVQIHPWWFVVNRVTFYSDQSNFPDTLRMRGFVRFSRAEACARGLASNTWTWEGPILASFDHPSSHQRAISTGETTTEEK